MTRTLPHLFFHLCHTGRAEPVGMEPVEKVDLTNKLTVDQFGFVIVIYGMLQTIFLY
jgi:hypothetical protein